MKGVPCVRVCEPAFMSVLLLLFVAQLPHLCSPGDIKLVFVHLF